MAGVCRRVLTGHFKLNFYSRLLSHIFLFWGTKYDFFPTWRQLAITLLASKELSRFMKGLLMRGEEQFATLALRLGVNQIFFSDGCKGCQFFLPGIFQFFQRKVVIENGFP